MEKGEAVLISMDKPPNVIDFPQYYGQLVPHDFILCPRLGNMVDKVTANSVHHTTTCFGKVNILSHHFTIQYCDSVEKYAEENSGVFSIIWMFWLSSAMAYGR